MYSFPNLGPVRCFMSGCNWTGLLAAAVGWRRVGEYHSELGPLLAGLSQHAWGAWSEGLLTVRETGVRVIPCEHMHLTWSPLGCPCPLLEEGPPGAGLRWGICGNRGPHPFPGSLCRGPALHGHSGVQAARAPPPGDSVTVRITLGPSLAACVAVTVAGRFTEDRERPGSRCLCLLPTQIYTFFSKQSSTQCAFIFSFLSFV